jgi:hypothetical protein
MDSFFAFAKDLLFLKKLTKNEKIQNTIYSYTYR